MSIVILGADGYLGWPLAMRMARKFPNEQIILADNQTRRRLVDSVGGRSITPVLDLASRIEAFAAIFHLQNMTAVNLDLTGPEVDGFFAHYRPRIVFHLAQVGSAAYSMKGASEAVFTLQNNESGNMRVLWAIRRHCPEAHIVKSGSMGQYAKCGLDLPEGYFLPEFDGKKATSSVLFPRQSDDVYHVSKINDSNYNAMACRVFGLRITDVMQSTVFGVHTEETRSAEALLTRFDHDEYFGTVVNRFIAQAVSGHTLTVYGSGWQRTGLMALEDAIASLSLIAVDLPGKGVHRVVNAVTEKNFCIREIAEKVVTAAGRRQISARISYQFDPRRENENEKRKYNISADYLSTRLTPADLDRVFGESLAAAARYKTRIKPEILAPAFDWYPERTQENVYL